jgi:general secretion pathway protein G
MFKYIKKNQNGFTLLELMIVIAIVSILSLIAIPKFNDAIAQANTARIQSDLQTIDTAIVMYQAQNGKYPSNIGTDLNSFITGAETLKAPKGFCFVKTDGTDGKVKIENTAYELNAAGDHALCQGKMANEFGSN